MLANFQFFSLLLLAVSLHKITAFPTLRAVPGTGGAKPHGRGPAKVISSCVTPHSVAITFDDGPYIYETDIIDLLNENGAKGTFFVNGDNWSCIYEDYIIASLRYAYESGHLIASHTWAHLNLSEQTAETIDSELERIEIALERILGVTPAWMRPPWGEYNDIVLNVSGSRGQDIVLWDFDSGDALGKTTEEIKEAYADLISQHPKNVLTLNHETHANTAYEIIPFAIEQLLANGYKLVTVSECLGGLPNYQRVTRRGEKDSSWVC